MSTGGWILVVAVALAVAVAGWRWLRDGRFRDAGSAPELSSELSGDVPDAGPAAEVLAAVGAQPGERATLLQFSSAFCAPCRATRQVLGEVAASVPGVAHVEVDAEHHLEHVRRLGVLRTPTTLVLDATRNEVTRASGAPRKEQVLSALQRALSQDVELGSTE